MKKPTSVTVKVSVQTEAGDNELLELTHDFTTGLSRMALHTTGRDPKGEVALRAAENALGSAHKDVLQALGNAPGVTRSEPILKRDWNGRFDA